MRAAMICACSLLALGFVHGHAPAQSPPPPPRPTLDEVQQARDTYIFQFSRTVPRAAMAARAGEVVGAVGGNVRHVYANVVGGFAATMPAVAVWDVAGEPDIIVAERDDIVAIASGHWCDIGHWKCGDGGGDDGGGDDGGGGGGEALNCPSYGADKLPWSVERINADGAHEADNCGQGVHVYVIDTGIDLDHASLAPVGASVDCTKGPSCVRGGDGDDDHGHGTHVAGTIGARGQDVVGVAPAVHLHSVKVLKSSGIGFRSDIIAGIDWVAGQAQELGEPVVANLSLGGSGKKSGTCDDGQLNGSTDAYRRAFCEAAGKGVVFVVAAGNDGADAENYAPASYDDAVITVSATKQGDDWPSWSNWGNNAPSWGGPASAPVAIAAPGAGILSTRMGGGTTTMSGTSMASPHGAGVAALLLHQGGGYAADYSAFVNVRNAILSNVSSAEFANTSGNAHDEGFVCAASC